MNEVTSFYLKEMRFVLSYTKYKRVWQAVCVFCRWSMSEMVVILTVQTVPTIYVIDKWKSNLNHVICTHTQTHIHINIYSFFTGISLN